MTRKQKIGLALQITLKVGVYLLIRAAIVQMLEEQRNLARAQRLASVKKDFKPAQG